MVFSVWSVKQQFYNNIGYVRFEVFTAVTMKNGVFLDVSPCGSCKNDVSEEFSPSLIRVTRIGERKQYKIALYFFAACVGC
jgi:hypothetical protein